MAVAGGNSKGCRVSIEKTGDGYFLKEGGMQEFANDIMSMDVGDVFRRLMTTPGKSVLLRVRGGELVKLRELCRQCGVGTVDSYNVTSLTLMPPTHYSFARISNQAKWGQVSDALANLSPQDIQSYLKAVELIDRLYQALQTAALLQLSDGRSPYPLDTHE